MGPSLRHGGADTTSAQGVRNSPPGRAEEEEDVNATMPPLFTWALGGLIGLALVVLIPALFVLGILKAVGLIAHGRSGHRHLLDH